MEKLHRSEGDINISPRRKQWQDDNLDAETKALLAEDAKYFLKQSLSTPCLNALRACDGIWIEDLQGRRYMDFHGNNVHQVGFANPAVIAAIKEQLDRLPFCTRRYTNQVAVDLARKLAEIAPGDLNKVLLCPGGAEAIGMALKLARIATGRHKTISMWDSFHGASLDAISIGGEATFRQDIGPLLPGTEHVPPPDEYRCIYECRDRGGCDMMCARYVEYVLEKEGDIAAVIAEPIRSTPYIPKAEYWQIIRKACDRHGALLIFDEIPHALGRTGRMFTCENFNVVPDMLVIGKGLGGGVLPLAALIAREGLDVAQDRALGHYTHEKSPVACAAALGDDPVCRGEQPGRPRPRARTIRPRPDGGHDGAASTDRRRPRPGTLPRHRAGEGQGNRRARRGRGGGGHVRGPQPRPQLQAHDGKHPHADPRPDDHPQRDGPGPRHHRGMPGGGRRRKPASRLSLDAGSSPA